MPSTKLLAYMVGVSLATIMAVKHYESKKA